MMKFVPLNHSCSPPTIILINDATFKSAEKAEYTEGASTISAIFIGKTLAAKEK